MAVFREFNNRGRDRAGEDRRRHRELVEDAIKKNIGNIIANESIIGQSKKKKVKIPIRGLKEFQFIYGKNKSGTGSGTGNEKRGDKIGSDDKGQGKGDGQAGNNEGDDIYEVEITIEELVNYLFEELNLPYLHRKRFSEIESDRVFKKLGYQKKGIKPRLAKKKSMVERIKRKKAHERAKQYINEGQIPEEETESKTIVEPDEERFPFKEDDLRYFRMKEDVKRESNAVIICVMDTSGSMDATKKYLARSFYFLLYQFIKTKYVNVEIVFVAHTTVAKEVNENDFFHKGESGGTYISSGYNKALEIIEKRYNPEVWNIYTFHCSDGDNWSEDNKRAVDSANKLCEVCNLFGYGEIVISRNGSNSTIKKSFESRVKHSNFSIVTMSKKEDVFPALKKLLEKEMLE